MIKVNNNLMADAVVEGNVVKTLGLIRAVAIAEDTGYRRVTIAGASVRAVVVALFAAMYTAVELKELTQEWTIKGSPTGFPLPL